MNGDRVIIRFLLILFCVLILLGLAGAAFYHVMN